MITPTEGIERIVVVANPQSTHADQIYRRVINPLENSDIDSKLVVVATDDQSVADNVSMIAEGLQAGDLVFGCGGDGMANIACRAVMQSEAYAVVPLGFGNANDIATSQHSNRLPCSKRGKGLLSLISTGEKQEIGAIEIKLDESELHAFGYMSIGLSAEVAQIVSSPAHRERNAHNILPDTLLDSLAVLEVFRNYKKNEPLQATIDGEQLLARELLWTIGKQMAKMLKFKVPAYGDTMLHNRFGPDRFVSKFGHRAITELPTGGFRGSKIVGTNLTLDSGGLMQYDGETMWLEPETELVISHVAGATNTLVLPK